MLNQTLVHLAESLGLVRSEAEDIYSGKYLGYAISLAIKNQDPLLTVATHGPYLSSDKEVSKRMKESSNFIKGRDYKDFSKVLLGFQASFDSTNPDWPDQVKKFLRWFLPQLKEMGYEESHLCPVCGKQLNLNSTWAFKDSAAYPMHESCGQAAGYLPEPQSDLPITPSPKASLANYLSGGLGAFLGASLGAIPWAILRYFGLFASILGTLIGYLALKGYEVLQGPRSKGKVVIIIMAAIFGIFLGTLISDVLSLHSLIKSGELYGATVASIPEIIMTSYRDPAFLKEIAMDLVLSLVFAIMGLWGTIRSILEETKS